VWALILTLDVVDKADKRGEWVLAAGALHILVQVFADRGAGYARPARLTVAAPHSLMS
jgi:hypothetical protein